MTYALDTNILSYVINGDTSLAGKLRTVTEAGDTVMLPLMVYYEARRGLLAKKATAKMRLFDALCARLGIGYLTRADMNTAADIYAVCRSKGKPIADGDLLIAAQCITNGYTLVTNNTKHFENVCVLAVVNWVE